MVTEMVHCCQVVPYLAVLFTQIVDIIISEVGTLIFSLTSVFTRDLWNQNWNFSCVHNARNCLHLQIYFYKCFILKDSSFHELMIYVFSNYYFCKICITSVTFERLFSIMNWCNMSIKNTNDKCHIWKVSPFHELKQYDISATLLNVVLNSIFCLYKS